MYEGLLDAISSRLKDEIAQHDSEKRRVQALTDAAWAIVCLESPPLQTVSPNPEPPPVATVYQELIDIVIRCANQLQEPKRPSLLELVQAYVALPPDPATTANRIHHLIEAELDRLEGTR